MSIFKKAILTRAGKALIAKTQAKRGTTEFTKAVSGSGVWELDEDLETADELREPVQEFNFSGIDIPDGNPATVVVTVILSNKGLENLYYVTELGIYAKDPDDGEVLYALMVTDEQRVYLPAENGIGISNIVERINIEVSSSSNVVMRTDTGLVSATDFVELKKLVNRIDAALNGGAPGQLPFKKSSEGYDIEWQDVEKSAITKKRAEFPAIGATDTIYVDTEDAAIYIWKNGEYFKLPLGADAAETLQKQISKNTESIKALETCMVRLENRFKEIHIVALADAWKATEGDGVAIYTQEIEAAVKATQGGTVWAETTATTPAEIVVEQDAQSVFFRFGRALTEDGKVVLTCYKKRPARDFGLLIEGGV